MRASRRSVLVATLCCLAIGAVVGGASAVGGVGVDGGAGLDGGEASAIGSSQGDAVQRQATLDGDRRSVGPAAPAQTVSTVVVTQEFERLPDRPGNVRVTRRFEIPDNVRSLRTTLPEGTTVTGTSGGFERDDSGRYEWTGGSRTPSITHVLGVNETGSVAGPEGADGKYLFADVGDWALFRRPATPTNVEYVGSAIRFDERSTTVGPGVTGSRLVYLGEHDLTTNQADGQALQLVVPSSATLAETRGSVLTAVADASTSLRVGQRDESVLMVAAPTSVDWAVRGLQTGESDFYVLADEPLDQADNTWLHEYVHTRQDADLARETRWLGEATATYYAALLALEQNRVDFEDFRRFLGTGRLGQYDSVVLADPATWRNGANYRTGALVAGELDRRIRLASGSSTDFQAVFRQLNEHQGTVSGTDFRSMVARAGNDAIGSDADRYATTTVRPTVWDAGEHGEAFGQLPARIHVALPGDVDGRSYGVAGPYRNRTLGEPPFVLVPGERLTFDVDLQNAGGTAGEYNLSYGIEGESLSHRTGSLDPGESTTVSVSVPVDATGDTQVRVGEYELPVTVVEPATPTIEHIEANRSAIEPGGVVGIAVDLTNEADRPGERSVVVRRDGTEVANRTVRLDAGESRTVTVPVRLDEQGTHDLSVSDGTVTVQVGNGLTDAIGPGVGPVGAVVVVLATVVLASAVARARRPR